MKSAKRIFRLISVFLVMVISLMLFSCSRVVPERPNILFAIADDWGWPHAGVYGDPVVQTPAFDRVASEGILFNHAYISAPSCTPSRNAILSGQVHWRLGPGASLWSTLDENTPVYPLLLEESGYHVGHWRKSWGPGILDNWEKHPAGSNFEGGFEEFLAKQPENTPFCFWLGTSDPHRPYETGTGLESGIDPEKIRMFECFPDNPIVRNDVADYYYEVQRFDSDIARAIEILEERGELKNTIIVITGDHGMPFPRCKANLYDSGSRVPLAILWGSGIQKPGRVLDDFISLTDLAPTFLELAGIEVPGEMTGKSMVSLLKSSEEGFVEKTERSMVMFGKERHVPGQELTMEGYPCRAIRNHEFLYIRNFKPDLWPSGTPNYLEATIPYAWLADSDNGPTKTYMDDNRDKDEEHRKLWELAFGKRPAEELYDCINDPEQLVNLADNPDFNEIREKMSAELMENLRLTDDPRVVGNIEVLEGHPYYGRGPRHPSYKPEN